MYLNFKMYESVKKKLKKNKAILSILMKSNLMCMYVYLLLQYIISRNIFC